MFWTRKIIVGNESSVPHICTEFLCGGNTQVTKPSPLSENLVYYYTKNELEKDETVGRAIN